MATIAKSRSGGPSLLQPSRSGGSAFVPLLVKSIPNDGSGRTLELRSARTVCADRIVNLVLQVVEAVRVFHEQVRTFA